jgi:hypothetical protein
VILYSDDASEADKLDAVAWFRTRGDQESLNLLAGLPAGAPLSVQRAARDAVTAMQNQLAVWATVQNAWYGLSLGSVLLLAAIGLAITFGVMGVINMAHGEMVMIGAYVTFMVQEYIRTSSPGLFDYSLLIAVPIAFVVAGLIGILIEQSIIRFLTAGRLKPCCDLGIVADPAAGGAHRLRPDQPRGRRAVVDERHVQRRPDQHHLRPALDHLSSPWRCLSACSACCALPRSV